MVESDSVLELEEVAIGAEDRPTDAVGPVDLVLRRGELALLQAIPDGPSISDVVQGLAAPISGRVRFLGRDWADVGIAQANALRGRIGRISADYGWISTLDVEENITLGQQHRTTRPHWEIRAEARRWAQAFGLPNGIPAGKPSEMSRDVLRRLACVRAFLGDPALIAVELPPEAGWTALTRPLVEACHFLQGRRTAILWATDSPEAAGKLDLRPTVELSFVG